MALKRGDLESMKRADLQKVCKVGLKYTVEQRARLLTIAGLRGQGQSQVR